MEEAELITRLRAQDEAALTELVVSYGGFINQVILHNLPNDFQRDFTEDIANRCFYQVWMHIGQYDADKGTFKNWLSAIVKHQTIDYQRGLKATTKAISLDKVIVPTPPVTEELDYDKLFASLSKTEQQVFMLFYRDDYLPEEIAKKMRMRRLTVYKHLSRGRKKLQEEGVFHGYFN